MKDTKLIIIFFLAGFFAQAQNDSAMIGSASGKTLKRLGRNAMKQDDPASAINFLEAYHRNNRNDAAAASMLAEAYMEIRDYERAQHMFLVAYQTNKSDAPEALYFHAQMQKSNGGYDSAKICFERFKKEYKGKHKVLKKQARKEIVFCDSVGRLVKGDQNIIIGQLDTSINKLNAEGSPVSLDSVTMVFSSLRTDDRVYIIEDDYSEAPKKRLYLARKKNGEWKFAGEYPSINDGNFNTGNPSLSVDGRRMYFTRCHRKMNGKMICEIFVSHKTGDTWGEAVKLPKSVNHPRFTSTMPAVTSDPVKGNDMIFFVTNNSRGKGGMDIWYTVYNKKKGEYKAARNAGSKINTPGNEITPFFDHETRSLYFSSDGLGGLGGFDIYQATGDGRRFTAVRNLGSPLNTGADDIYYTMTSERNEGFFVSNRKGGAALPNSTCCDDIYTYRLPDYRHITLKGVVLDMINTELPVRDAMIDIYVRDEDSGERFYVKSTSSDSLGHYSARLAPERDYFVVIRKKDFLGVTDNLSTKSLGDQTEINRVVKVVEKPTGVVPIPDFNYDFGKADLNAAQKKVLDKLLVDMLVANPEIIVEIQSHTDSKGNELFNQKLSQKRSESVVNYAISKGIEPERLIAKGYGESQPLVPNENPNGTDNPENRAKNRRTEFKIIGTVETGEPEPVD